METLRSGPIRLKVYGVERTLVDCLWRQAQAQRMQRVMAPYLEALL